MKLLVYTINGDKIGIDIQTWSDSDLDGNSAFLAVPDTGSTPSNYVDISSITYWDQFGTQTTLTHAEIRDEIVKLISGTPTPSEYEILWQYEDVGYDEIVDVDNKLSLARTRIPDTLSGITDSKISIEQFNEYTGTTAPNTYVSITNFNAYSGDTNTLLDTKVDLTGDTMTGDLIIQDHCLDVLDGTDVVFKACNIDNIVYISSNGLTGITTNDDMSFYADGKGAFGDSVTMERLRANTPGDIPRSLSLIDTNAVMRIWRYNGANADPAVEFVWGTGDTPTTPGNAWWDMYLDGAATPNDVFSIRRRTDGNVEKLRLTVDSVIVPMTTTSTSPTTGALIVSGGAGINENLNVNGTTTLSGTTIGSGLAKYDVDYSGTYDNRTLVDKEFVDTHPLTYLNTTSAGATTTTSTAYVLQTGMQITNVPAGTYLVGYGTWVGHGSANAQIYTSVYVGGTAQTGSEMMWSRGAVQGNTNGLMAYNNFVITLGATATVEIRWRTNTGTATSTNRYITLLKVNSLI